MRFFLISLFLLLSVGVSQAATIHVPADQPTIQAALDAAQAGDVVLVASGTYNEHELIMKSGVWLRSESGEPDGAVIDAQRLGRVIYCEGVDADATIEGFTLTGGFRAGYVSPDGWGGGIFLYESSPLIRRCLLTGNEGQSGGGGICAVHSSSIIEECRFTGNSGVDGGGIYVDYSTLEIRDCVFDQNHALVWGGAVFCENLSSPVLTHCTLANNRAWQGGGIWCVWGCFPSLVDCLVAFSVQGGGVYVYDNSQNPSMINLACSDVFGNIGGNYGGIIPDQTGIDGNISDDPLFCDAPGGDFRLSEDSPCLPQNNSCEVQMGAMGAGCPTETAVGDDPQLALSANSPNPLRGEGVIRFRVSSAGPVSLRVFDASGRLRNVLVRDSDVSAGVHEVRFDGRDQDGAPLETGVYFCRMDAGGVHETLRVTLLR